MKKFRAFIIESKIGNIKALQPNTKIEVFHGSDIASIIKFVGQGVDAQKRVGRLYPHWVEGKKVDRGLFVTPDLKTALHFGDSVIKFTALGKDLYPMFSNRKRLKNPDEYLIKKYPKSFRPDVSYDMLERGNGLESQALYLGLLSPRAITKVYLMHHEKDGTYVSSVRGDEYKSSFGRTEFIKWVKDVYRDSQSNERYKTDINIALDSPIIEPQEANTITPDEFYNRIHNEHGLEMDEIKKIVWNQVKRNGTLSGLGDIPRTVQKKLVRKIKASQEYRNR